MDEDAAAQGYAGSSNDTSGRFRRRGPYAIRACDNCRRRKGKCDGRLPCRHCKMRKLTCIFSPLYRVDLDQDTSDLECPSTHNQVEGLQPSVVDASAGNVLSDSQPTSETTLGLSPLVDNSAIMRVLVQLQKQVDFLVSQAGDSGQGGGVGDGYATQSDQTQRSMSVRSRGQSRGNAKLDFRDFGLSSVRPPSPTGSRFCGPTSPEFSMNLAQMKLSRPSHSTSLSRRPSFSALADSTTSGEDSVAGDVSSTAVNAPRQNTPTTDRERLLFYRSMVSLPETMRLLQVYREAMGDLHPIIDLNATVRLAIVLGNSTSQSSVGLAEGHITESNLLVLNLCLMLALRAETNAPTSQMEEELHSTLGSIMNARVVASPQSLDDVAIILLMVNLSSSSYSLSVTNVDRACITSTKTKCIQLGDYVVLLVDLSWSSVSITENFYRERYLQNECESCALSCRPQLWSLIGTGALRLAFPQTFKTVTLMQYRKAR